MISVRMNECFDVALPPGFDPNAHVSSDEETLTQSTAKSKSSRGRSHKSKKRKHRSSSRYFDILQIFKMCELCHAVYCSKLFTGILNTVTLSYVHAKRSLDCYYSEMHACMCYYFAYHFFQHFYPTRNKKFV